MCKYKTLEKLLTRIKIDVNIITVNFCNIFKNFNKICSVVASKLFKFKKKKKLIGLL